MRQTEFRLEGIEGRTFAGYTDGRTWNGWAVPLFDFDQAEAIAEAFSLDVEARYVDESDEFEFTAEFEPERFGAADFDGLKLYAIGSGSWMWEEVMDAT